MYARVKCFAVIKQSLAVFLAENMTNTTYWCGGLQNWPYGSNRWSVSKTSDKWKRERSGSGGVREPEVLGVDCANCSNGNDETDSVL